VSDAIAARPSWMPGIQWGRRVRRVARSGIVVAGAMVALLVVGVAIFAHVIAPHAPDEPNFELIEAPPSFKAWFGTDRLGRDVLSRVIYGSRISLSVALVSIGVSMLAGGALGLGAGLSGGAWDNIINRVMDVFFSIPGLLLAVGVAAMRGPGVQSAVLAIAIVYTPVFVRVMRGPVLAEREKDYVEAVRALGATRLAVALKHVLPNVLSPFVVQGTVAFSQAVLIEASLSYLGLSAQPPTPSWGNMLNEGRTYLETAPWISVFPGIAIMVTVLAFNLLGDGLRDVLDPNSQ
jgi:peptide/nickel transport system permease protein